jgi:hypothetical protein
LDRVSDDQEESGKNDFKMGSNMCVNGHVYMMWRKEFQDEGGKMVLKGTSEKWVVKMFMRFEWAMIWFNLLWILKFCVSLIASWLCQLRQSTFCTFRCCVKKINNVIVKSKYKTQINI